MFKFRKWLVIAFVLTSCVGCDQVTKTLARTHLAGMPVRSYFGDLLRLQYSENPGAFLSLGAYLSPAARFWIFTILIGIFLIGLSVYLIRSKKLNLAEVSALSLILAGGIGNLIDRTLFAGKVTDFLNIGIGMFRTGIFNVADIAIMGGTGLMLYLSFMSSFASENSTG